MKRVPRKGSRRKSGGSPAAALLRAIAAAALSACDAAAAVQRLCRPGRERLTIGERAIPLRAGAGVMVIAFGKAAPAMTEGLVTSIREAGGKRPVRGLIIAPRDGSRGPRAEARFRIRRLLGDHPVPARNSFRSGREALRFAAGAGPRDDVIFLASGGGSALMAAPLVPFLAAADKTALHRQLIVSGASIAAINTVRKHLSAAKGGRLAAAARRARTQTTLVLCDVEPERYEEVASGPSLPDRTTIDDMVAVIDRHGLPTIVPHKVLDGLRRGSLPETPASGDPIFRRSRAHLVLSNRDLRQAAERAGLASGLAVESMPRDLIGSVEEGAETVARAIEAAPPGSRLLVMGGEVLNLPLGTGKGGRAQEFALRLALRMKHLSARPWSFLAIGSDGIDGRSPAAGAFVDATTLDRAGDRKIDPEAALRSSNSYRFFRALGDDVVTGLTGTNLRDLYLLLTGDVPPPAPRVNGAGADRQPLLPEPEN